MKIDKLLVIDKEKNGVEYIKLLHQQHHYKGIGFHKLKLKLKKDRERTYFYIDEIDMERLEEE